MSQQPDDDTPMRDEPIPGAMSGHGRSELNRTPLTRRVPAVVTQPLMVHPAVADVLKYFDCDHLAVELQAVARPVRDLAYAMAGQLQGPQLTIGLQHLLAAKDAFVRAALP